MIGEDKSLGELHKAIEKDLDKKESDVAFLGDLNNASFALDNHKSWSCNRDLIDGLLSDN